MHASYDLPEHTHRPQQLAEFTLWMVVAVVVSARFWLDLLRYGAVGIYEVIDTRYLDLLIGLVIVMFPSLFRLVFGALPLQFIRLQRIRVSSIEIREVASDDTGRPQLDTPVPATAALPTGIAPPEPRPTGVDPWLVSLADQSRQIAAGLYTRAGVYLIIGVLVAFSGLGFFYLQTLEVSPESALVTQLSTLAPRFGILFFIEFIAFFFLRQYQSAMEEFRYYEAIKRRREETLALLSMLARDGKQVDVMQLVTSGAFYSAAGKLAPGESTEILESRKLSKDEIVIFERIVEALGRAR